MADSPVKVAAQLLGRRVGLRLDPAERGRLAAALRDGAAASGCDLKEYVSAMERDGDILQDVLDRVTVQETSFFRDPAQFDALARHILPKLSDPVTVWSAGCSNGQEPYSVAMVLDEAGRRDWSVIATDISTPALDRTRMGRYSDRELRNLPLQRRARYLVPTGGRWTIVPALRERILVARHNLASDPPPFAPGACSVVLCRNVLIYFSREETVSFLERLVRWLPPDGVLFLGYSESLWHITDRFRLVRLGAAFAYQPRGAGEPSAASPPRQTPKPPEQKRARTPRTAPPTRPAIPPATAVSLMAEGEAAAGSGDYAKAATVFRRAAYLDPGHVMAHLHLGLVLEKMGDRPAARSAYLQARAVLDASDASLLAAALEGYQVGDLRRLLDHKVAGRA